MEKLPHERLREDGLYNYITDEECSVTACSKCEQFVANKIADEIEKYYIPRPRFEDGEPVQFGDEVEDGTIHEIAFWDDGTILLLDETPETIYEVSAGCFIKRPEPKALDAKGVEINVGETVWIIESGAKGKVEEINKDRVYVKCDDGWLADVHVSHITHREPDSLEKLRDDMREFVDTEYKISGGTKTNEWLDRLAAIMERDACLKAGRKAPRRSK